MPTGTHVALIRGINVGGHNLVPMAALREALLGRGFADVRTYIQSGNVIVAAPKQSETSVAGAVEETLEAEFGVTTVVVAVAAQRMREAVSKAPTGFGSEPDKYHYDVAFLAPGVAVPDALAAFSLRAGVDTSWAGDAAVYFRRLSAQRTKSKMSSVTLSPIYKKMTIRNWRTTVTLVEMLDA